MKHSTKSNPFFMINPKSYLTGKEILKLAIAADRLAGQVDFDVYFTAQYVDLRLLADQTENLIITAQHMDGIDLGRGMGFVTADALKEAGVTATMINHAEHSLTLNEVVQSVEKAKEKGITSIVCADSVKEAKAVAMLNPDIILCEPTELIGTGQTSDDQYIQKTNQEIRAISTDVLVMQAAGISTPEDVYRTIAAGADGTGCTSGIVLADDPINMIENMLKAVKEAHNN
ncbi:triose-phosphate isomerase [Virgibacillus sp. LDC-1]|uniref:triose-phosphate isomerase n=1 Tax=Virgibacillus sp. LDC-1 TaxID=3039856 RepID=UPI0024DE03CD|nr:triose-phosphate isomerase [Virgibacillus sp. LDC-1]